MTGDNPGGDTLRDVIERQRRLVRGRPSLDREEREAVLQGLEALLKENCQRLADAMEADFHVRPRGLSVMYDVLGSIGSLRYARKHLRQWMKPERRKTPFPFNLSGARVTVEYQAKGMVGILGTWNMPVFTIFSPLAQVVAAGNRAVLKPSELAHRTADTIAELMPSYVDVDRVAVVTGDLEVAKAFSRQPFDHLVLTGGTPVGREVMAAAADNLTPLTLELGGKSPVVVGRSADICDAAEKIMFAKATNAGQLCIAPDCVFVPAEWRDAFIEACEAVYHQTHVDTPEELGSIINRNHKQRLQSYLQDARTRGYEVRALSHENDSAVNYLPMYIVTEPERHSLLGSSEVFGPILNVHAYQSVDEALEWINAGERPLALYYFGKDKTEQRHVLDHTSSGGVTINNVALHPGAEDAPFGGIGASGMGHYHGREGFLEFSHARTVFTQGWFDVGKWTGARAPFGDKLLQRLESALK